MSLLLLMRHAVVATVLIDSIMLALQTDNPQGVQVTLCFNNIVLSPSLRPFYLKCTQTNVSWVDERQFFGIILLHCQNYGLGLRLTSQIVINNLIVNKQKI